MDEFLKTTSINTLAAMLASALVRAGGVKSAGRMPDKAAPDLSQGERGMGPDSSLSAGEDPSEKPEDSVAPA